MNCIKLKERPTLMTIIEQELVGATQHWTPFTARAACKIQTCNSVTMVTVIQSILIINMNDEIGNMNAFNCGFIENESMRGETSSHVDIVFVRTLRPCNN